MKAKNVINVVKEIKERKEITAEQKQETIQKKEEAKQTFLLSKLKCVCKNEKCDAIGGQMKTLGSPIGCPIGLPIWLP